MGSFFFVLLLLLFAVLKLNVRQQIATGCYDLPAQILFSNTASKLMHLLHWLAKILCSSDSEAIVGFLRATKFNEQCFLIIIIPFHFVPLSLNPIEE